MERLESQAQAGDKTSKKHKSPPRWITESMWRQCQHLDATMPEFGNLCRSIVSNYKQWKMFEKFENPYEEMHRAFDASKVDLSKSTVVLMRYLFNKLNIWGKKLLFQYYSNSLNIEAEMGQF